MKFHRRALDISKELEGDVPNLGVSRYLLHISETLSAQGNDSEALTCYQKTLEKNYEIYGDGIHVDIVNCLDNIGKLLDKLDEDEEALDYHLRASQMRQELSSLNSTNETITTAKDNLDQDETHHYDLPIGDTFNTSPFHTIATSIGTTSNETASEEEDKPRKRSSKRNRSTKSQDARRRCILQ